MIKYLKTASAPSAIGPYSQGVVTGNLVFVSGQIALDPTTGKLAPGGVAEQTERVMRNIEAILSESGSSLARILKTTVYLTDLGAFEQMNAVYGRFLGDHRPARATVQVAALPRGAGVEIDAVALLEEG